MGVFSEDMCPRRLLPYRGIDGAGNPITNPNVDPLPAVLVQDAEGIAGWAAAPGNIPPEDMVRVGDDAQAADLGNYVPFLIGKTAANLDERIVGSDDVASGQWKLVWVSSVQQWTTVPEDEITDLCTALMVGVILDPGTVGGYVIRVVSTASMAVGGSLKLGGYEVVVTEVIDGEYIRVENVNPPVAPVTVVAGASVCNIGFRPCPRVEEPYADEMVACLDGIPVAIETPTDVNSMKVPGVHWRDQLGQWSFLAAPVDPITGIVVANYYLATPGSPAAAVANIPGFKALPRYQSISRVTLFTQLTGGLPTDQSTTVVLSGTAGYIPGATAALISIDAYGLTGTASYHCYIKINGKVEAHVLIGIDAKGGGQFNGPFLVPLDGTTEVDIEVDLALIAAGTSTQFSANVYCDGYIA